MANISNRFANRDLISITDLTKVEILEILRLTKELKNRPQPQLLKDKVLASLFFEPSTRTRLSFETAMERLGGKVIGFADQRVTSASKGETLHDTIRIIGQYADAVVIRHPLEGAARLAAEATDKPVLNAGDGANQHPTQTLLDLFSIQETQKKLTGLSLAMVGDLKYGRTIHSLTQALINFKPRLYFVAPESLQIQAPFLEELKKKQIPYTLHQKIEEVIHRVDIFYLTRIQKERFIDIMDYEKVKNTFRLDLNKLKGAKKNLRVLHPLPRVNELDYQIDQTPFAYYFQQAQNGLYVRQALLGLVLGKL